ncbi:MAG: hypothetical protein QXG63_03495 [Nitrososphaerales archaeon]
MALAKHRGYYRGLKLLINIRLALGNYKLYLYSRYIEASNLKRR